MSATLHDGLVVFLVLLMPMFGGCEATSLFTTSQAVANFTTVSNIGPAGLAFGIDPDLLHAGTGDGFYFQFNISSLKVLDGSVNSSSRIFAAETGVFCVVLARSGKLYISKSSYIKEMALNGTMVRTLTIEYGCVDMRIDPRTGDLFCSHAGQFGLLRLPIAELETADAELGRPANLTLVILPRGGLYPQLDGLSFAPSGLLYASVVGVNAQWPCGPLVVDRQGAASYLAVFNNTSCPDGAALTNRPGSNNLEPGHLVLNLVNGEMCAISLPWDGVEGSATCIVFAQNLTRGDICTVKRTGELFCSVWAEILLIQYRHDFMYMGPGETTLIVFGQSLTMVDSRRAFVRAQLQNDVTNTTLAGAQLRFEMSNKTCTAETDADGIACCLFDDVNAGSEVVAYFAGTPTTLAPARSSFFSHAVTLEPASGPCIGGTVITLRNSSALLQANLTVGSQRLNFTSVSADIIVTEPLGQSPVCGNASVFLDGVEFANQFRFIPQIIGSIFPVNGAAVGGTVITISADAGAQLCNGQPDDCAVLLSGSLPCIVLTASKSVITCRTTCCLAPNSAVDLTVRSRTFGNVTALAVFTFVPQTIGGLFPASAPTSGQDLLEIRSTSDGVLSNGTDVTVFIGNTVATVIAIPSNQSVIVRLPKADSAGAVNITVVSVTYGTISQPGFTYLNNTINSIWPTNGPAAGGNQVTIYGLHLGNGSDISAVLFCNLRQNIVSQTQHLVVVDISAPSTPSACDIVTQSRSMHNVTLSSGYRLHDVPRLTAIIGKFSLADNGVLITITGENIGNGSDITAVEVAAQTTVILWQNVTGVLVVASRYSLITDLRNVTVHSTSFGRAVTDNSTFFSIFPTILHVYPASYNISGGTVTMHGHALGDIIDVGVIGKSAAVLQQFGNESMAIFSAPAVESIRSGNTSLLSNRGFGLLHNSFSYYCDAGFYGARCELCAAGNHCNGTEMVACPAGTANSDVGSQAVNACTPCPPGSHSPRNGTSLCLLCPLWTYCPAEGMVLPIECPPYSSMRLLGATEAGSCIPELVITLGVVLPLLLLCILACLLWACCRRRAKIGQTCKHVQPRTMWNCFSVPPCILCKTCHNCIALATGLDNCDAVAPMPAHFGTCSVAIVAQAPKQPEVKLNLPSLQQKVLAAIPRPEPPAYRHGSFQPTLRMQQRLLV